MIFKHEQLNFLKTCFVVFSIISCVKRDIFKQQWDSLYPDSPWMDSPTSYKSFAAKETSKNKKKYKKELTAMKNGNRKEWDCSVLAFALLYSESVGQKMNPNMKKSIDVLRESRNEVAHNRRGELTNEAFEGFIERIVKAFKTLNLNTNEIEEVKHQESFEKEKLNDIKKELENAHRELEEEKEEKCGTSSTESHFFSSLGNRLVSNGTYDVQAVKCIEESLEAYGTMHGKDLPYISVLYLYLGDALYNVDQLSDAKDCYLKALAANPAEENKGEIFFKLGLVFHKLGEYLGAKAYYEKALKDDGHIVDVALSLVEIGDKLRQLGQLNQAKECYDNALATGYGKDCPSMGESFFKLGDALRVESELDVAKECFKKALMNGYDGDWPSVGELLFKLGDAFAAQREPDKAKECFEDAFTPERSKSCPSSVGESLSTLGHTFFRQGQLSKANWCFSIATKKGYGTICPSFGQSLIILGNCLVKKRQFGVARIYYEIAIEASYDTASLAFAILLNNFAVCLSEMKGGKEASSYFGKARDVIKAKRNKKHPCLRAALYNYGNLLDDLEENDLAIKYYKKALKIKPDLDDSPMTGLILSNLGCSLLKKGKYHKAKKYCKNAMKYFESLGYNQRNLYVKNVRENLVLINYKLLK